MKHEILAPGIEIYCADCLEVMKGLDDKSVDAVITDPPYGVSYAEWDSDIPSQEFLDNCLRISSGAVIMFGAATMMLEYSRYKEPPERILIWSPAFTLSHTMSKGIAYRYHPIFIWNIPVQIEKTINWDVLSDNTECGNWWKHPATKPVSLMSKLIAAFGGDTVLDPYMGSGTTGVAAVKNGRKFKGMDTDPGYYEIAKKRIKEALMQPRLL